MSIVTVVYWDTLTYAVYMYTAIPGWSWDVRSYYGLLGYSGIPCTCTCILPFQDRPGMPIVTMVYWDTSHIPCTCILPSWDGPGMSVVTMVY